MSGAPIASKLLNYYHHHPLPVQVRCKCMLVVGIGDYIYFLGDHIFLLREKLHF